MRKIQSNYEQVDFLENPSITLEFPYNVAMSLFAPKNVKSTDAQFQSFLRFKNEFDPVADRLVECMHRDGKAVWEMFNHALEHGIDIVVNPPSELVEFFREVDRVPYWLDYTRLDSATDLIAMVGDEALPIFIAGLALSYVAPDANEVLIRSGDLHKKAGKRAVETLAWYNEVTAPGGLARFGAGLKACVRIRLIHAHMRRAMNGREDWNRTLLGNPIHQCIYVATIIPFSLASSLGALALGHVDVLSSKKRGDIVNLWRYIGYLVGVHPELQPADESDLWRLVWLQMHDAYKMDHITPMLGGALFGALPEILGKDESTFSGMVTLKIKRSYYGNLARIILGNRLADALSFPKYSIGIVMIAASFLKNASVNLVAKLVPGGQESVRRRQMRRRKIIMSSIIDRTNADLSFVR
ncbi:oxygenase MpaB family protein [Burkholderia sp. BDU5]|uniref:oxygenase MpaB family protein n=1 Tax=Burkholderia sp. BDU5 TaxID=1385590 RepID=UPI000AFC773A|nr:oxygenase MpaB family protein [Burkholderia sp. BDU5]